MSMKDFRIDPSKGLELGIYTLGEHMPDPHTGKRISPQERIKQIIEMAKLADEAGLDVFNLGESHQEYFVSQAHAVILGAIAQQTKNIKIGSAATIASTSDPVRIYENFATLDLISGGRAEITAGRASRVGLFKLLGYNIDDYKELFEEKFDLLRQINENEKVTWQGKFRAPLEDAEVLPRPLTGKMPIWRAVGGPAASAIKAGKKGVPMMIAMLGGDIRIFERSIDAWRNSLEANGFNPDDYPLTTAGLLYTAKDAETAKEEFYPYLNNGIMLANGDTFNKRIFEHSSEPDDVMVLGSPQEILEKILYQHEIFNNQRYMAEIDFGALPFEKVMDTIYMLGEKIVPAVKKYTTSDL
ncbi:LLM class flavin-dependent oxidoreductase [Lactobacillus pasteurii]|uniref:Oxidoreductase n=1 Tax=Lactobacillus pasteurii DSM 23907 = CRBIP 24.76 TaxID=1423790 RepID=I7IZ89_9LACO|nr:LLM class flavin-dependent oxidoreductase [Lactobacillus pasteurii]TDG77382.1 hypothetical protein C5L33_000825 [Lactobacillus pasteurii]CCI84927.1 Oxidoreductase [Lactobacillus pasteurii DSM 23907 = CRBIP 24.76]